MEKCSCQSYNRPDLGGSNPPIVMKSKFVKDAGVCIDACMVSIIQKLWDNNIVTLNSCCGHNGRLGPPSVIVHPEDSAKSRKLTEGRVEILYWKLIKEKEI